MDNSAYYPNMSDQMATVRGIGPTTREPQIRTELNMLQKSIVEMRDHLEELTARLTPVTTNLPREIQKDSSGPPPIVPMASDIRNQRGMIEDATRQIRLILDGLEL